MKTLDQVRVELRQAGITQKQWAKAHGFTYSTVRDVFNGSSRGIRGASHDILVALGVKDGSKAKAARASLGVRG